MTALEQLTRLCDDCDVPLEIAQKDCPGEHDIDVPAYCELAGKIPPYIACAMCWVQEVDLGVCNADENRP